CPVVVLCGPGNNGGDGFVVARLLDDLGWPVRVALLGDVQGLRGDAAVNASRWEKQVEDLSLDVLNGAELVVDALFGAGLSRPLEGVALDVVKALNMIKCPCVAIDVPSGVQGDSGRVLGAAPKAALTVTFFRRKPGHLLMPGRQYCGETVVANIGIPEKVLKTIGPMTWENAPDLWRGSFPQLRPDGNKYDRGHAVVIGGAVMTGAARLAAYAARRIGAGLVTIAAPTPSFAIYASGPPGTIVAPFDDLDSLSAILSDTRKNAVLVGPGGGVGQEMREKVSLVLGSGKGCVLDADALTSFADGREALLDALHEGCLLTPHEGEYTRLFGRDGGDDRLTMARKAASLCGAVVLLKGADTVIAAPDGRAAINVNAPPTLATAGSGDVLAGIALGLIAQGMPVFEAACAAAWIHGEAARQFGPGLVAEDLSGGIPHVLSHIYGDQHGSEQ
ncbi:MAG: NAD(P)H-hydrate dehydratase, partial [Rhodospirillales bacterium]|nr:NAD(P)H-hydrate dehydratase [Rhodospirillales bacterium]